MISHEPCSKPFLDLNAISGPYACTLRNTYATTIGAYAEDYGQHNLTHCLRDPVSWRKMTPHCSVGLRIPMAQGRYLDVFLLSGFLFESITQGFQYLTVQAGPTNKPGIIVYVRDFHGYPSLRAAYARLTRALRKKTLPFQWRKDWKKTCLSFSCWAVLKSHSFT